MGGAADKPTRVLLVGDAPGVVQLLRVLPPSAPVGVVGASNRPQYHDELRRIADGLAIPFLVQPLPRSGEYPGFLEAAAAAQPDLVLCNSYSMILHDELLRLAPRGGVNVHGGKVPEFRGANPIQWAIIEGEREAGVTMHEMTSELDAGAVIAERRVPIRFADTWVDVARRIQEATEELLVSELPSVLAGTDSSRPQDESAAQHRPRRTPDDSRIDWSWSVARIYDFVRALGDGIPAAFYERGDQRVELERLSLAEVAALAFEPGPGGKRFARGTVELTPAGGELLDLRVLRDGEETGLARLEPVDLEERLVRVRVEPDDAEAAALAAGLARVELGFTVVA